jgi:hypothetical protein
LKFERGKAHILVRNSDSVLRRMIEPRILRNTAIAYCALRGLGLNNLFSTMKKLEYILV